MKAIYFLLLLFCCFIHTSLFPFSSQIECSEQHCGRLLVQISSEASFSPEEFAKTSSAILTEIDPRNPHKTMQSLFLDHPFIVLSDPLAPSLVHQLSMRYGYRYVCFDEESLESAIEEAEDLLLACPMYSSEFPYLPLDESLRIYNLMKKIDEAFEKHKINYWAGGGTLLGAIRHGGLIPWDDDLDLYILDSDEEKLLSIQTTLEQEGLILHHYWKDLYKIFEKTALPIQDPKDPKTLLPFGYPAADVFVMTLEKGREAQDVYVHKSYDFYWHWNMDRFDFPQIVSLVRVPFGPIKISIPSDPESYLCRLYGEDQYPLLWKRYAKEPTWNHRAEKRLEIPGCSLVEIDDFSAAPWK